MFGILNLNKPPGVTSRAVVSRVYRVVRPSKAGHAGTLDPMATGVLLVPVGPASRLVPYLHQLPKQYRAEFEFGKSSDTDDSDGNVIEHTGVPQPSISSISAQCDQMIGRVMQRPPNYSAIKVNGERAYRIARKGESVELSARPVDIFRMNVVDYVYPQLSLEITCGSGTYIRSIGRDLAEALGTQAIMTALVRTAIGDFRIEDSSCCDSLDNRSVSEALLPAARAVSHLPSMLLSDHDLKEIGFGRMIHRPASVTSENEIAALDQTGELHAILVPRADCLKPKRVFQVTS